MDEATREELMAYHHLLQQEQNRMIVAHAELDKCKQCTWGVPNQTARTAGPEHVFWLLLISV
jgi:hypothetical protein